MRLQGAAVRGLCVCVCVLVFWGLKLERSVRFDLRYWCCQQVLVLPTGAAAGCCTVLLLQCSVRSAVELVWLLWTPLQGENAPLYKNLLGAALPMNHYLVSMPALLIDF